MVAVVLGLAAPAWPCVATVTGSVSCSNTDHVAQWVLANGPVGGTMLVGTVTEQIGPDFYNVTGFTPTVLPNGTTTGTSVVAGFETNLTGLLTLSVWVRWPDDNYQTQIFTSIDLGRECPGSTPTTTTTTSPPSTTTTYPNTTTTYPNNTTTTCGWCNTTTTYPVTTTTYPNNTTSTCGWCNTTTTYPVTTTTCSWCNTTTTSPVTTTTCSWCNTTTTSPVTTTTCSWCNTTTTSPVTTTTCSWCNTTTTYPVTTTTTYTKLPKCGDLSASPGDGRAIVRWAAPSGGSVTDYVVTTYVGSSAIAAHMVGAAHTNDVVSGLANGKTYRFRVTAETANGSGPPSSPTNAVTIGVPTAPTGVTAAARAGKAELRWKAPAAVNGSRLTAYVVTPYSNGVAMSARRFSAQSTRAKVGGLKAGQHYTFRVAALNHRGMGPQSDPSNAVTPR